MTDQPRDITGPERPTSLSELRAFLDEDLAARARGGHGPEPITGWVALRVFRLGQYLTVASGPVASILRPLWKFLDFFWVRLLLNSEMMPDVSCGPGLVLPGGARRIIFPEGAVFGSRVTVNNGACLGGKRPRPVIGDDVVLWNDSYIVRGAVVGRGAHIGPWATVMKDVPAGGRAMGTPATLLPDGEDFDF